MNTSLSTDDKEFYIVGPVYTTQNCLVVAQANNLCNVFKDIMFWVIGYKHMKHG